LPSGKKRFFVHSQTDGRRIWKIIGDADSIPLDEARRRAAALLGAIRRDGDGCALPEETVFEAVAEEVFRNYGRHWKPRTLKVNRGYLRNQILPWFRGRCVADIARADVQRWFASLHATPVAADRSAPILSVIMREAEVYGYRPEGSNPCVGIRRYRRKGRERFLSGAELRRLALTLERHEARRPLHVAFLRLLLLTGCRKSEIATLEWSSYREGRVFLPDSKTGPRTVWLSSPARSVLERLPRAGKWVFPSSRTDRPLNVHALEAFWCKVRAEANLRDVRLHDTRHTYASIAIMQGETVVTTGRLLGHSAPETTLKYAHLSDASVREAADALGDILGREG
ncbi:MAG: tyrosine-type recombinase/integrase, partial [Thiotrichales bacterium]|nr:tyrosine-type recombinase/integrase [Thiotrichales bacterium]